MTDDDELKDDINAMSDPECDDSDADLIVGETNKYTVTSNIRTLCPCVRTRQFNPHTDGTPRDRYNLLYLCFFLAGAGFLFPFNSFVAAVDYFHCLYQVQFPAVAEIIPVIYLLTTLAISTLNLLLVERLSASLRIMFGYCMFSSALFFVPMLDIGAHNGTVPTEVSFYLTLAAVLVIGLGSGFQQSSYYGLSSMLPPRYSQALLAGESIAGFIVSVNRIFTKLVFSERVGAIVFFTVSLLFVLMCVGCFVFILRSPFVKYHTRKCRGERGSKEQEMESWGKLSSEGSKEEGDDEELVERHESDLLQSEGEQLSLRKRIVGSIHVRLLVVSQIWRLMITIFTTYLITLLIFPGLISEIRYDIIGDWTPVILVALFNFTDFIAKWAALLKIRWNSTKLMLAGFLRLLLIPVVILCVSPSPCSPVLAQGVIGWGVVLAVVLGFSNGYFGSLPMINVSMEVKDEKNREMAGTIMIWTLLLGLTSGAVLAYAVTPLTKLDPYCTLNNTCASQLLLNETYR